MRQKNDKINRNSLNKVFNLFYERSEGQKTNKCLIADHSNIKILIG